MEGNIQVVQNFVALTDLASSIRQSCSRRLSAILPLKASGRSFSVVAPFLRKGLSASNVMRAEVPTEEWRMAPGPLEVAWFAEETAAVERAVDALNKRLEKLEANDAR